MKKLICLLGISLICFNSFGQAIINRAGIGNTVADQRLQATLNFFAPRYADTTAALSGTNEGIDSCGAIIFTYDVMAVWFRSCYGGSKKWVMLDPSGIPSTGNSWRLYGNAGLFTGASGDVPFGITVPNYGIDFTTNNTSRFILDRTGILAETGTTVGLGYDPSNSNKLTLFSGGSTPTWQQTLTAGSTLTGDNTVDNGASTFTITNNTLGGDYGVVVSSNSTAAASGGQSLGAYLLSGANANASQLTTALTVSNTHTGTTPVNYGINVVSQSGGVNEGLHINASNGTSNIAVNATQGSINIGTNGTETGQLKLLGSTSGTVTIQPAAAAGTYNLNLPTSAGTSGQFLTSGGGVAAPMTWTDPIINADNVPNFYQYSGTGNVYFYGNSIVNGFGTTSPFRTIISNRMGWTQHNFGVDSRTLEHQTPLAPGGALTQNLGDIPTKGVDDKLVVILCDINDAGFNYSSGNYNVTNFKAAWDTVITNCLSKGWLPNQILILASGYITQTGLDYYGTITGTPPTFARIDSFLQASKEVSETYNVLYLDMFNSMKNNGDSTMLNIDGVHPLATGDTIMANAMYNYLAGYAFASYGNSSVNKWNHLYMAEGGQINWDNGDATITQTNDALAFAGANVSITGLGSGTFPLSITNNVNSFTGYTILNNSTGASAQIQNRMENNNGDYSYYGISSTNFSGFTPFNNGAAFFGGYQLPVSVFTQTAHPINFYTNATLAMTIASGGNVTLASLTNGLVKSTSGVLSNATAGTDYVTPTGTTTLTNKTLTNPIYTSQALTDGATITWNSTLGTVATVTLAGNRTLAISNPVANTYYQLTVTQDGTGSRTLALPAGSKVIGGGAGTITLTTAAGSIDIITCWYDGTNYFWNYGLNYN